MYVNPRKTTSIRPLAIVDVTALQAAVAQVPEDVWAYENDIKPNRFGALDQARHIVFRFVHDVDDWRRSDDLGLWSEWRDLLEPVMDAATRAYGYQRGAYPRVMLARLPPGGVIVPHRDANPAAKWPHKIHVPLQTNDRTDFFIEGVSYNLPVGHAVEVNNMAVHAVKNDGATDRIHLIFEYYDLDQPDPEWIAPLPVAARA